MTNSWNPPTGPPNGAPIRPGDARREIEDAVVGARTRDGELRARLVAIATDRVQAADRLDDAADEVDEATSLAKRALARSNESARAGQRADAAKWTGAAQVFAMRVLAARAKIAFLEARLAAASEQSQRTTQALAENVGRLQAVAAARLPLLSGRKAARLQRDVDEVAAAISAPTAELVVRATAAARAAAEAAETDEEGVQAVADVELESELDVESTDELLAELRTELGLPAPKPPSSDGPTPLGPVPASDAGPADAVAGAATGAASDDTAGGDTETADDAVAKAGDTETGGGAPRAAGPGNRAASRQGTGKPTAGRTWPVPATRR